MTLKEWNARNDLRMSWKEFYKTPSGQALKEVLSFLGTPVPTMPAAGVDFIDWNAMVNARREGFFEAIRLLGALTEEPAPAEELPQPWEKSTNQLNETEGTQI
jgi:hypothetical protein